MMMYAMLASALVCYTTGADPSFKFDLYNYNGMISPFAIRSYI